MARADAVPPGTGHVRGSPGYRRLTLAVWSAGVATFSLLYAPQALLPPMAATFGVSPGRAALVVSAAAGALALALVPVSLLTAGRPRVGVMTAALAVATGLGLLVPLCPTFETVLVVRVLQGAAMAGLPALAMAHLSEEVHAGSVGHAMGLFVAGNTAGGLAGRLLGSAVADAAGWRAGLLAVTVLALACAVGFRLLLPPVLAAPPPVRVRAVLGRLAGHAGDPSVRRLCATAFLLTSSFVTVYNYLGFRLVEPPFTLSQTAVGLVFLAYLAGTSTAPSAGRLGDRLGARNVLWTSEVLALLGLVVTLGDSLPLVLLGLSVFTVGFFGAHTTASGWLSRHVRTGHSQASALYLLAYYAGSSLGGWAGGLPYEGAGWPGTVGYVAVLLVLAVGVALLLRGR